MIYQRVRHSCGAHRGAIQLIGLFSRADEAAPWPVIGGAALLQVAAPFRSFWYIRLHGQSRDKLQLIL